jgi:hypothetical protein
MSQAPLHAHPKRDKTPVRSILAAWSITAMLLAVGVLFVTVHHPDANRTASTTAGHFKHAMTSALHSDEDDVVW